LQKIGFRDAITVERLLGRKRNKTKKYKSFTTAFESACERANLPDVTPLVLRHTFASRLVMKGVDLRTVQELGGWKSLNMVQRYAHLSQDHKRRAVELLAENFPSVITPPAGELSESESSKLLVVNKMGR
jgi:site-specific recombinase XerD